MLTAIRSSFASTGAIAARSSNPTTAARSSCPWAKWCSGPARDRLDIALHPDAGADVERMKKVVADHLDRFAFREAPLAFNWQETA